MEGHLTILMGIGQPHPRRELAPRAVALFNAMHHPALRLALLGVAAVGIPPTFWLAGALAFGQLVIDGALGAGLRTADGWQRRRTGLR